MKICNPQADLGEKEELTFEEFQIVMSAYKKDIEKAQLDVRTIFDVYP